MLFRSQVATAVLDSARKFWSVAGAEWRMHWKVVLAACVGMAVASVISYSSSLFIDPLEREFGWSRAQIMSGHSIASIAGVIAAPFTGLLVDRIGPRRLGIFAVAAICLATALFSVRTDVPSCLAASALSVALPAQDRKNSSSLRTRFT